MSNYSLIVQSGNCSLS